ncbi:VOC family protein [Allorhizobium pseudoryzae]|uniref:VOC family protein n=1 Tax=Allorhizobium pseudoryzae TaxID=379684 RepID=UPI003CFC2B73
MIHIDHVCLGVRNFFEGSQRLREETGLGCYEGGWFPKLGLANKIFPTGSDTYIEVESVVDVFQYENGNACARFFKGKCEQGDVFIGWCARVDTRDELEQIAKRLGTDVIESTLRTRPDGTWALRSELPRPSRVGVPGYRISSSSATSPNIHRAYPLNSVPGPRPVSVG